MPTAPIRVFGPVQGGYFHPMARLRHIFRLLFLPLIMLKRAGDLLHDRCFRAGYRAGWLLCGAPADSQPDKTGR